MENKTKLDKEVLALHKTEQFPQEEFIDQTDAFPGEGVKNEPMPQTEQSADEKISEHIADQQSSPGTHQELEKKPDEQNSMTGG